ncbi:hypothetical protein GBA52_011039 [Prunus armeniaca]|nr:hypothetical protein GBA52_011039 [Prunus armeniaca]
MTLFFIFLPFSPSINSLISFSTSSLFASSLISMPIPHSLQVYRQFICWSPKNGQQSTGTPAVMLSTVEFQPLCVKNPPTEGWLRTCSCGHHPAIRLLSLVSATNSRGKIADSPITRSGLITQKNGSLLFASPHPNSTSCSGVTTTILPKFT